MKRKFKRMSLVSLLFICFSSCMHSKDVYPEFITSNEHKNKKLEININWDNESLFHILPVFSAVLKFDYILKSSKHYKPITASIQDQYTERDVWDLFLKILKDCNASYTVKKKLITIFPNKQEKDKHVVKLSKTQKDKIITITDSEAPKKMKRMTREDIAKIREEILKRMQEKRKANPNK